MDQQQMHWIILLELVSLLYLLTLSCYVIGYVLGYQCEKHNNPADFFLDIISTSKTSEGMDDNYLTGSGKTILNEIPIWIVQNSDTIAFLSLIVTILVYYVDQVTSYGAAGIWSAVCVKTLSIENIINVHVRHLMYTLGIY